MDAVHEHKCRYNTYIHKTKINTLKKEVVQPVEVKGGWKECVSGKEGLRHYTPGQCAASSLPLSVSWSPEM